MLARGAASLFANLTTYTLYAVFSSSDTAILAIYSEGRSTAATMYIAERVNPGGAGRVDYVHRDTGGSTIAQPATTSGSVNDGSPHLYCVRRISSASFSLRIDGTEVGTSSNAPGSTTIDNLVLGARYRSSGLDEFFNGLIGVVAMYSDDNYATVEPILKSYYGIS